MEVVDRLYGIADSEGRVTLKRGETDCNRPGSVRRVVTVLEQLDLTYDLYGITAENLISLLPPDFEKWLTLGA